MRFHIDQVVQSIDTAFKEKASNDYSVVLTWGIFQAGFVLINAWRGKPVFPDLKKIVVACYEQFKPAVVLIEDAASGQSLIQELRRDTRIPIVAIKVDRDKIARANSIAPLFESGRIYIPRNASWKDTYIHEMEIFPGGKNDDLVDATTQFLNWARTHVTTGPTRPTEIMQPSKWR